MYVVEVRGCRDDLVALHNDVLRECSERRERAPT